MVNWTVAVTAAWIALVLDLTVSDAAELREELEDQDMDGEEMEEITNRRLRRFLRSACRSDPADCEKLLHARAALVSGPGRAASNALLAHAVPNHLRGPKSSAQAALDRWHGGRWSLAGELGRGSSGAVFQSSDSQLGEVAIKFVQRDEPGRLEREIALLQRVAHENVCRLYEHRVDERTVCMVMELLEQGNLAQRIRESLDGRIREFEVIQMAFDVLSALEFMHTRGVTHGGLRPANILFTEVDGRHVAKLINFSIAAVERETSDLRTMLATTTHSLQALVGTPHYMSPEQYLEDVRVTAQTDLWSLGVVLFESLSGVLPFASAETDLYKIGYTIVSKEPPELSDVIEEVGTVTDGINHFTLRALQKDLLQRFSSAAEMTVALNDAIATTGANFGLFISCATDEFAQALYTAASKCQLGPGRENRPQVYLDKVRIVDGQRFDANLRKRSPTRLSSRHSSRRTASRTSLNSAAQTRKTLCWRSGSWPLSCISAAS